MPLYTTDALILRTYKLGESDRIVVFLTRDRGKKRGAHDQQTHQQTMHAETEHPQKQGFGMELHEGERRN